MTNKGLKPREIVEKLNQHIIGQMEAKKAVAIALRNRWRRQNVSPDLADEILPKNIIMIGPTGVGKTEIARRLAKLDNSPFLKIEASKFTEVGYVGRDVESMIRDLVELSMNIVKSEEQENVRVYAAQRAEEKLLDLLLPPRLKERKVTDILNDSIDDVQDTPDARPQEMQHDSTREKLRKLLKDGRLDERMVEIEVTEARTGPMIEIFSAAGMEDMGLNIKDVLGNVFPQKKKVKTVKVPEALKILEDEETQKLIDMDKVTRIALGRVEQSGIIFLMKLTKSLEMMDLMGRMFQERAFRGTCCRLLKVRM